MTPTERQSGLERWIPILILILGLTAMPVYGEDSKLEIHGFLTQAWATTDFAEGPLIDFLGQPAESEILLGIREDGTFDYRNLALQFRYAISEKDVMIVQISHQATGTNPVDAVTDEVELDWAFYERKIGVDTSLKVGRVQIPFGIFNEIRDVGTILPFYRPPFSIYLEGSFTSETIDGLVFSHTFGAGSPWSLSLDAYAGEFGGFETNPANPNDVRESRSEDVIGTQLWLNTPVSGLRFGLSYFDEDVTGGQEGFFRDVGGKNSADSWMASVEGQFSRWTFRSEYRSFQPTLPPFGGRPVPIELDLVAWYAQIGVLATDRFHVYGQYERQEVTQESLVFARDVEFDARTDLGLAFNFLISANLVFKAEYHWVDLEGAALFPVFTPQGPVLDHSVLSADDGSYAIVALSTSF